MIRSRARTGMNYWNYQLSQMMFVVKRPLWRHRDWEVVSGEPYSTKGEGTSSPGSLLAEVEK